MTDRDPLVRLLGTAGADAGCDDGFTLLAAYVEGELEGRDVGAHFPELARHLRNCAACAEDHEGLLALVRGGVDADGPFTA
jgi:hypothetical protein